MPVKNDKKYDELMVLKEIYRMRGLTVTQLCEVIFESRIYAYRYLKQMQNDGLLTDRMTFEKKVRKAKVYSCTDKGIELLEKRGLIEKRLMAKDNTPQRAKLKYTLLTNEVYAALMPYGIEFMDSREWKNKYNMDRNTLVRGGLKMMDDREVGIYLFFSPTQLSGAGLSNSMLERFKREIKKFAQSNRIAVICYDLDIYKRIVKAVDEDTSMLVKKELLIIPMGKDEFGFNLLRLSRSEVERKHDLENILNARLSDNHPALDGNKQNFASYVAKYDDKETYVLDFLSMNRPVLHHLSTHYHVNAYQKDGRKVEVVCWKPNESELEQRFKAYPHVKIIPVPLQDLHDKYLPGMIKEKIHEKY